MDIEGGAQMTVAGELIKALRDSALDSERSQQTSIGPSELGGCRRRVYHRIHKTPVVNDDVLTLSAVMGTAIHGHIEKVIHVLDPTKHRFETEIEVEAEGIKGHIDVYDRLNHEVMDWKTTKIKNLGYFPTQQQRWQVQVYGWLMDKNGYHVEKVTLVAISRDGDERDIVYYSEDYDPKVALQAIEWLQQIQLRTEPPAPERDVSFCKHYCPYYDEHEFVGCKGRTKNEGNDFIIDDLIVQQAAQEYLDLGTAIKALELKQDQARAQLDGVSGTTLNGITVKWSTAKGRSSVDEEEVKKILGYVPTKTGRETIRLSVKGE
jgi:hypothetical protein